VTRAHLGCLLVSAALGSTACAGRTDAQTKAAFVGAGRTTDDSSKAPGRRPSRPPTSRPANRATTWAAVTERVVAAIRLLASASTHDAVVERAITWCAVRPEPRATPRGNAYSCFPSDPLEIDKRSFALSVFPNGVIGLQMDELDDGTARTIAERARVELAPQCATPFVESPSDPGTARAFFTCPVDGGSSLAVGYARSSRGPGWFVSLSVLGEPIPAP
jgi:hypothetical protein